MEKQIFHKKKEERLQILTSYRKREIDPSAFLIKNITKNEYLTSYRKNFFLKQYLNQRLLQSF